MEAVKEVLVAVCINEAGTEDKRPFDSCNLQILIMHHGKNPCCFPSFQTHELRVLGQSQKT